MRTYVRAETEPLHQAAAELAEGVANLVKDNASAHERISRLESGGLASSNSGHLRRPAPNDMVNFRVSFLGFLDETHGERVQFLRDFKARHFESEDHACFDSRMEGPGKKKLSKESYIQFFSRAAMDRILDKIKAQDLGKDLRSPKGAKLTLSRMKTDFQRSRDWSMRKSEELIRAKLHANGTAATVEYTKTKDERKITVNGHEAFVQIPVEAHGSFRGDFRDLALP